MCMKNKWWEEYMKTRKNEKLCRACNEELKKTCNCVHQIDPEKQPERRKRER